MFRKKTIFLLVLYPLMTTALNAQEQKWKELTLTNQSAFQAQGLDVHLFKETWAGLEGQQFTVKLSNLTTKKLSVKGSLNAVTYCGNTVSVKIEVTIKAGKTIGGSDYLFDNNGLTGTVQSEDCKTDKVYPNPNDRTDYKYDRIRTLQLSSISITPVTENDNTSSTNNSSSATNTTTSTGSNNSSTQGRYAATNAGYYKTNTTNTPGNFNNKNTNSLYNGTVTNNKAATRTATNSNNYAQQYQQQQNYNQQQQQIINNTINDLGNIAQNYLQQRQAQRDAESARQQQAQEGEKQRKEHEEEERRQREQEEADRYAEEHRIRLKNIIKESQINASIAGTYYDIEVKTTNQIPDGIQTVYYVAWERFYFVDVNVSVGDNKNIRLLSPVPITKYNDGTWMMYSDLRQKIKKKLLGNYPENKDNYYWVYGYFTNLAEAKQAVATIRKNAINAGFSVTEVALEEKGSPINASTPAKKQNKDDFWNN